MKKYENGEEFVKNFSKDAKAEIKNGNSYECEVNGINVVVSAMDNNNASKVTIYSGSVDGVEFSGSITALKKRLNITYTKEYNRSAEASTKVVIKSDGELAATAKTAAERIRAAVNVLRAAVSRYGLTRAELLERTDNVEAVILETLKQQRDKAQQAREAEERRKAAEAAKREAAKQVIMRRIAEASTDGNMAEVIRLTSDLKRYM